MRWKQRRKRSHCYRNLKFINELHNLGLVKKSSLPSDMRVVLIHLTELGEQYIEKYITKYHSRLKEEFKKIGESDCLIMINVINKVYGSIKKVYQE